MVFGVREEKICGISVTTVIFLISAAAYRVHPSRGDGLN